MGRSFERTSLTSSLGSFLDWPYLGGAPLLCQGRYSSSSPNRQCHSLQAEPGGKMGMSLQSRNFPYFDFRKGGDKLACRRKGSPTGHFGHNSLSRRGQVALCLSLEALSRSLRWRNTWMGFGFHSCPELSQLQCSKHLST